MKQNDILHELFMEQAVEAGFGKFHLKIDPETQLFAIIAMHSTKLGPALGGCRFIQYDSIAHAFRDAMRLAQGMSYKSALANLPIGGGKCVIIEPKGEYDREALFASYAKFVDELGGNYITAVDAGTQLNDMDIVNKYTDYVTCTHAQGDASPSTAWGVMRGIEASLQAKYGSGDLSGKHIAIQGVGKVGFGLANLLSARGAKLTVADPNERSANILAESVGAKVVGLNEIVSVKCDVFSPCALGAIINSETINKIQAPIIAGAANNIFSTPEIGEEIYEKGILCAPDYVVNAGGLIYAAMYYLGSSHDEIRAKVDEIYNTLTQVFERSAKEKVAPEKIANEIAKERIG